MTHLVEVTQEAAGYRATPLGFPEAAVIAPTRDAALRGAAEALASRLARSEIVAVELPEPEEDPLDATFGLFRDDPELARQICAAAYAARDAEPLDEG